MEAKLHTLLAEVTTKNGLSDLLALTTKANGCGLAFSLSPATAPTTQDSQAIWRQHQLDSGSVNNLYAADY